MIGTSFEALVTAHHLEIYRYLLRITMSRSVADDLSQETFLRAYRAYCSLPPDANVRAWLFAIATNLSRNHVRATKRQVRAYAAISREMSKTDEHSPEETMRLNELKAQFESAVSKLPFKQRVAFTLRKLHDVDYEFIAHSLDCSVESARANVFQALRTLRQSLNGHLVVRRERVR
jgi:RNA polymerase sigma factor (sigma-70 family)